jgi:hypothetical protein
MLRIRQFQLKLACRQLFTGKAQFLLLGQNIHMV